jgi:hypothetical protein
VRETDLALAVGVYVSLLGLPALAKNGMACSFFSFFSIRRTRLIMYKMMKPTSKRPPMPPPIAPASLAVSFEGLAELLDSVTENYV